MRHREVGTDRWRDRDDRYTDERYILIDER